MLRRTALIALLLALAAPAPAIAQTQQDPANPTQPFSPLPPPQPTPAPTPEPDDDDGLFGGEISSGGATLYLIAGALLVAFIAMGMYISRDARRALPAGHRPDAHRLREEGPHKHKREAKARARARGRAQKAARRKNR